MRNDMTTSASTRPFRTRRALAFSSALAAAAGALVVTALPASATTTNPSGGKVTLCHATGSTSNPYVQITVAAAGAYHGHYLQHADLGLGDIIPPFTYQGHTYSLNWDSAHKKTYNHGCTTPSGGGGGGYPPGY
jgi:hypothetical protein